MNTPKMLKPLTMDEVKAIRAEASPLLKNTIDLVMLIAQRRSDVLSMRHSDIQGMTLHVTQQKTGIQKQINITSELQEVIDRCYDGSTTGYILHKSGERVSDVAITLAFRKACKATGLFNNNVRMPIFHQVVMLAMNLKDKGDS